MAEAGFNLALGADFRIIASDARMATPFIKRGLATGTNLLQQYIGVGKAIEMFRAREPERAQQIYEKKQLVARERAMMPEDPDFALTPA